MKPTSNLSAAKLNRRNFLRGTALSATAFMIVPGTVRGSRGAPGANARLNLAGIGIGGQGAGDLKNLETENIVALCDVDRDYAAHTFKKYPKARQFADYRQMLDQLKEIDGVVIATPDHHHAFTAMEAVKRRKHVYCEKPLTHSVWEARRLAQAAREAGVATQMGKLGQASEQTRRLCERVWAGAIEKVREAHIWTDRPSRGHFEEWTEACKGGAPAGSNFDWAGPLTESVLLGNVALRLQLRDDLTLCKLLWDPAGLKFTNLEEANKFLRREYRSGWTF